MTDERIKEEFEKSPQYIVWCIGGYNVLVDKEDYDNLKQYKYYQNRVIIKKDNKYYFYRNIVKGEQ